MWIAVARDRADWEGGMRSRASQGIHGQALARTVVTNSIRTIAPHTTFRNDPTAYMNAEINALKEPLLYGDKVHLKSYLLDVGTMAEDYETYASMPCMPFACPSPS
jgi:hypothetical protein